MAYLDKRGMLHVIPNAEGSKITPPVVQVRCDGSVVVVVVEAAKHESAVRRAMACHEAGIETVAIGFGSADRDFLYRIATSDETAVLTCQGDLLSVFGNIVKGIVESECSGPQGLTW